MSVGDPGWELGQDFAHLHVHTDYSMLDGAARVEELLSYAEELGQKAMAITDHGYLFGAFDFWQRAQQARDQADHRRRGVPHPGDQPLRPVARPVGRRQPER